ncbi:unnamed protein product [Rhizopus stolonifer]
MDFTEQYWLQKHISLEDPTFENPFPTFSFRDHYRINRSTFDAIVNKCMGCSQYAGSILQGGTPVEIQIATVFWRFSNSHYGYRITEMTLGVSAGSFHNFNERFLDAMMTISKNIIVCRLMIVKKPPTLLMDSKTKAKPIRRGNDYVDRKGRASVNMMAVCNHKGQYMYIKLGISVRTHDASQFKSSALYAKMLSCPDRWFPNNEYIVGDAAYPLLPNLMVPFKNTGRDRAKIRYNLVHS